MATVSAGLPLLPVPLRLPPEEPHDAAAQPGPGQPGQPASPGEDHTETTAPPAGEEDTLIQSDLQ